MKQTSPRCFRWKPEGPSLSGLLKMKVTWTHFLFQMLEEGLLEAVFPSKIHPKAAQILIIQIQTLCVSDRIKTLLVKPGKPHRDWSECMYCTCGVSKWPSKSYNPAYTKTFWGQSLQLGLTFCGFCWRCCGELKSV